MVCIGKFLVDTRIDMGSIIYIIYYILFNKFQTA